MSWTYFTSYLDGTRPITLEERDELYDQFALKLTECGDLFELNATNQTAIKDSKLLTDLTSITDTGTSAVTTDDLAAAIIEAGPYGDLTGYEILQQAGTAEGLTSGQFDELFDTGGRVVLLDHYRVWNILKRAIDLITCIVPDPTLVCRTASASKTKCGFQGLSGGPCVTGLTNRRFLRFDNTPSSCTEDASCVASSLATLVSETERCQVAFGPQYSWSTIDRSDCSRTDSAADIPSGTKITFVLSNEHTTAMLSDDVDAAIPAFSGSYSSGTCSSGAYHDKSSDELTCTKRAMQYKFTLPDLTGHTCYRIEWDEVFTPEGGGSTTVTAKSYQWDGSATETGAYTINPPSAQGTTTIANIVASFDCPP